MRSSSRIGRTIGLLALLLVAQPGMASHFRLGRPPLLHDVPPIPPLVGPRGSAYKPRRTLGNVVFDEQCLSVINFNYLQGLEASDRVPGTGDEIICTTHLWIARGGAVTVATLIRRGEVRPGGRVHSPARLDKETGVCAPQGTDAWFEMRATRCYEPDPAYAPSISAPFASDPTQGFVLGEYAPRPATRLIAVEGNSRAVDQVR